MTALDTARLVLKTPRRESVAVRTRMAPLLLAVTAALKCVCGHFHFWLFWQLADPKANSLRKALAPAGSDFKNGEIVGGYAPTGFMNSAEDRIVCLSSCKISNPNRLHDPLYI